MMLSSTGPVIWSSSRLNWVGRSCLRSGMGEGYAVRVGAGKAAVPLMTRARAASSSVHEGDLVVADDAGRVDAHPRKIPDDHNELILRVVCLGQVEDAGVGAGQGDVGEGRIIAVDALPDAAAMLLVGFADACWRESRLVVEPGEVPCSGFGICPAAGWLCGHASMVACRAVSGCAAAVTGSGVRLDMSNPCRRCNRYSIGNRTF